MPVPVILTALHRARPPQTLSPSSSELGNCEEVTRCSPCSVLSTVEHGMVPAVTGPSVVTEWPRRCPVPLVTGFEDRLVIAVSSTLNRILQVPATT